MGKVRVWDFDNVLFSNPDRNYSDEYLTIDKITDKKDLPIEFSINNINILVTGRGQFQEDRIKEILGNKKYSFDKYIFFGKKRKSKPDFNNKITKISYYKKYWDFKVRAIKKLKKKFKKKYKSIKVVVVDDDTAIIDYCEKKGIDCKYFNITKKSEVK
jgi:hypothetical protein